MKKFCLKVKGDRACFSRPEFSTERYSYDVITPSAARGIFEAIFWKPPVRWRIEKIEVLADIKRDTILRNEVKQKISQDTVRTAMKRGHGLLAQYAEEDRAQRATSYLKNVVYRLHAALDLRMDKLNAGETPGKYDAMFECRARKGKCFHRPYLGCREFDAHFEWVDPGETPEESPIKETRSLGWMLYDMDFSGPKPRPLFFNAEMKQGVIMVPPVGSEEVRG